MRFQNFIGFLVMATVILGPGTEWVHARDEIRIVGSTAVLPYMKIVAENFAHHWDFPPPSIEDTGTGRGFRLFGSGVGFEYPDILVTCRPVTDTEWTFCRQHGVDRITEMVVGRNAIVFVNQKSSPQYDFTVPQLFCAMAAHVEANGERVANPYHCWNQISPQLPEMPIRIMGPTAASSAYDALIELVMVKGCQSFTAIQALNAAERFRMCRMFRGPSKAFMEGFKFESQIADWLSRHPAAFAFLHYAVYKEYSDQLAANPINGVRPTLETMSEEKYPLSQPIYLYIKIPHEKAVPGLQQFLYEATSERAISPDGYLVESGFIPLEHRGRNHARDLALSLAPLSR